jgi:hypothetical protein
MHKILVGKTENNWQLEKSWRRWKDNTKFYFKTG